MKRKTGALFDKPPQIILKDFQDPLQSDVWGIIYHQNHTNYQIVKSKKLLHKDSLGRKQKK